MLSQHHDRPRSGGYRAEMADTRTNFHFDVNYLRDGYFSDEQCEKVRDELLGSLALDVAKALVNAHVKLDQLRQCFDRVCAIERNIGEQRSFDSAEAGIVKLKSEADFQAGCGLVGEDFKRFIDRNVELALQKECNLTRGFIPHFAAVLGSFAYLTRPRAYRSLSAPQNRLACPPKEEG